MKIMYLIYNFIFMNLLNEDYAFAFAYADFK